MLEIEDTSVLSAFEEDERTHPAPRKVIDSGRTIYASRKFRHPKGHSFGQLVLCDLGEARIGPSFPYTNIQPDLYKAPEMLFMLDWNQSVDIWNVACVVGRPCRQVYMSANVFQMWDMIQAQHLFDGRDEEGYHNNRVHIGEMVNLVGHPPLDFQRRSAQAWRVFDYEGRLVYYAHAIEFSDRPQANGKAIHLFHLRHWRPAQGLSRCRVGKSY